MVVTVADHLFNVFSCLVTVRTLVLCPVCRQKASFLGHLVGELLLMEVSGDCRYIQVNIGAYQAFMGSAVPIAGKRVKPWLCQLACQIFGYTFACIVQRCGAEGETSPKFLRVLLPSKHSVCSKLKLPGHKRTECSSRFSKPLLAGLRRRSGVGISKETGGTITDGRWQVDVGHRSL